MKIQFVLENGEPRQYINRSLHIPVKLSTVAEAELQDYWVQIVKPYDLLGGEPLWRFEIVETEKRKFLFFECHHSVGDGMTLGSVFIHELDAILLGKELTPNNYTILDYAEEENETLGSDVYKRAKDYYIEKYSDTNLLTLTQNSDDPWGNNIVRSAYMPLAQVDEWSKDHGTNSSCLYMAALGYVLSEYSREDKVSFSMANHGRTSKKIINSYGMFVRSSPILAVVDRKQKTMDYISGFRREFMSCIRYGAYPFNHFCRDLNQKMAISFGFQGKGMKEDVSFGGVSCMATQLPKGLTSSDLNVTIYQRDADYDIRLSASDKLYSVEFLDRMAEAIKICAQNMMANPDAELSKISIVSQEEQEKLLALSEGKELQYNKEETYVDMVVRHAEQQPDAVAVVDVDSQITYKELDVKSNMLANALLRLGLQQEEFVGLMLPRRKEFEIAILGVQKAGGAYVPMDSEYPIDRLAYMIEDSEANTIVTTHDLYDQKSKEGNFTVKNTIFIEDLLASDVDATPVNNSKPEGLAYMIYTSGSTGKPKGVMLPHKALRAYLSWRISEIGLSKESRNIEHASFSFDASLDDLLCPLAAGGQVHLLPEELRKDLDGISQYIRNNNINGMTLSTALGMALLNQFSDLPLNYMMMGGEKLLPFPKTAVKIFNGYGPTEFSVCSSFHVVDQEKDVDIPIGRPVPNTYSFICDKAGNLLPLGVPGELCLCGDQMARGYWHRAELTEEKFCDCPFLPGHKMYRTGDVACWNKEGNLEFMGRIDNQVKIRGFRVEMGEIENAAKQFEGIKTVAAEVKTLGGTTKQICLYYSADKEIVKSELEAFLAASLAEYMVPTVYMQMDELPLTPNGKVNRKALPEPTLESGVEYVKPEGNAEETIAEAIAQVLAYDKPVGALDNFFTLGGDSIKSIRLVSILRTKGINIKVSDVLQNKTVRAIAAAAKSGDTEAIDQESIQGEIKKSAMQYSFISMNLPKPEHFNQSMVLTSASVDVEALKKALKALTVHHDMLRAVLKDSTLFVRQADSDNLYGFDEKELKTGDVNKQMEMWANELQESMDLANGPLFKAMLIHLADKDALLLCAHHLIVDGISWRIIIEDLNNAYVQASSGIDISLPAKTHSFKYYAEQVSQYRDSYILSQEKDYWTDVQTKMKNTQLSNGTDYSRQFERKEMVLSGDYVDQLLYKSSSVFNTDANDLLLAALCRSYKTVTGKDSVSVQMEGHGREPIHTPLFIDRTVGWFTSVYPVVFEALTGDVRKDIRLVKETFRHVPNKGLGYGILQYVPSEEGDKALDTSLTPLIGFNYLGDMSENSAAGAFAMDSSLPSGRMLAKENAFGPSLMINCIANKDVFTAMLDYDKAVWSEDQINALCKAFEAQVKEIAEYLAGNTKKELTASDLGAVWTEEEFETISSQFEAKGEHIQLVYPMSPMQEAMLLKYQMEPDSFAYRLITRFALTALPTEEQLRYALDVIGAKHEVLRSNIIYKGVTEPCQAIIDRRLGLKMKDVSAEPDKEAAILAIHQQELKEGFDLQNGPLMRVVCIKTGDNSCQLLFALHHAIVDGWCIPIYMTDFLHALADAMQGNKQQSTVNTVTGRYAKFVHNLLRLDKKGALKYWKAMLAGYDTKAIIPTYGEEPEMGQNVKDSVSTSLSVDEAAQFKKLCSDTGVTPNTVVELAWALVLQKFNRVNDVVFGKVVSGRDNTEDDVNDLVGIFINTIPERIQLKPELTVKEALLQIQSNDAKSNKYDFCALSEVQQQSDLGQDLFQSILVFENYPSDANALEAGLPFSVKPTATKEETFVDLSVTAFTSEDGRLAIEIKYDNKQYTEDKINQVLHSLITVINGIMADASAKAMSLPLLNEADVDELKELSKGPHLEFDTTATFASLFTEQAQRTPDALAVADENSEYTYAQLAEYSDTFAHKLIEYGIKPNTFVCVMLDRTKEFPLTVLAVHKVGAAYTPLDLEYPNERLSYMIENSESKVVITTHSVLAMKMAEGDLVLGDVKILYLDDLDLTVKSEPINLTTPDNLAYMIYTSGSTGLPKGVILHQRGLRSYIASMVDVLELTDKDRISNHRPFSFDAHIQDLYPVLTLGGSIHIMPSSIRKDMKGLRDFIVEHKVTGGSYTTSLGAMLLDAYDLPLRYLTCTGEKMIGLVSGNVQIYNGYGPTECTDLISVYKLDKGRVYKDIPIGRPMANSYCFIVDQNGCLQPRGVAGELCFASIQVGIGYWKLPEKTAEVFGDCPYLPVGADGKAVRMYHTGDLCRWNKENQIEYLGRIDSQVKLRGFRIELGEIETQASKVEGIKQAVAVVREVIGAQHLILYYTVKEGMQVSPDDIRAFLESTKLAEYMIPEIYMELPEFPFNSSGKVNRKALPMPDIKVEDAVEPETKTEKELFNLVVEILKHDKFGVTTNLISVGMTSLSAMRLSALAQKKMQLDIKTKDLLTTPTIRAIAAKIDKGAVKKMTSMRLGAPAGEGNAQKPAGNNPFQKRANPFQKRPEGSNPLQKRQEGGNPLQKRPGGNPFQKRNDNK